MWGLTAPRGFESRSLRQPLGGTPRQLKASVDLPHLTNAERLLAYLDAYARKDIASVGAMFADDVTLRDWNQAVRGKDAALAETAKNFSAAGSFAIEPLGIYADGDTVAAWRLTTET